MKSRYTWTRISTVLSFRIGGVEVMSSMIRNLSQLTLWNKLLLQRTANPACIEQALRVKQTYTHRLTGSVFGRWKTCLHFISFVMLLPLKLYLIQKFEKEQIGLGIWNHIWSTKITDTATQKPYYSMFLTKKQLKRKEVLKIDSVKWIRLHA
jgi:hypothetical protein